MSQSVLNEEKFETEIRKFLKKVGITSHREIEQAVREALRSGRLQGRERLPATMTLEIAGLGLRFVIDGEIGLG
jgi:hypothetical protein